MRQQKIITAKSLAHSVDAFLGGRVMIHQPLQGYRAAMDAVLLAASLPAPKGPANALDIGCGVGTAGMCYMYRCPKIKMTGIEFQPTIYALAKANIKQNNLQNRYDLIHADISVTGPKLDPLKQKNFDMVLTNPPFLRTDENWQSPCKTKQLSNQESTITLKGWLHFALARLKQKGNFAMIHRADRLDEILALLHGRLGEIEIIPLWPKKNQPARRVILRGRKAVKGGVTLHHGLILHDDDNRFRPDAMAILQDGKGLDAVLGTMKS